eukprot:CAMPEP_0170592890 /NCGR_PEP_ID=MMETSP0224-20130122/13159_1 /TAXON_ID=285029 /ORGANISM="Togula jolla, Strain CCCM 725" /LENGTH=971 /DNA_ID=CAMNT_0010916813 /DNA_START=31 /DNA_END=2946 /DNA_ORIENTATION=-
MPAEKEIPWCTVFLCGGALLCHTMVLVGNIDTSDTVHAVGKSADGWAAVGISVSDSLHVELDALLANVTVQLTDAINRTMQTQQMLDMVLSMVGSTGTDAAFGAMTSVSLLQTASGEGGNPMGAVMEVVTKALAALPHFQQGLETFQNMLAHIKPALLQVGIWVNTFADKVQATVESFGTTMDRVQKIMDQLMSKISPTAGEGEDLMLHDTFNLFDTDNNGWIEVLDLQNCAELYALTAVQGNSAIDLVQRYDADEDGMISKEEFPALVNDESITAIMATVLRAYAKRLSQVAGNVAASRMRDEVASTVVQYFQLVVSKNLTKVGWVSNMLTNGTLPIEFTADVMAELALQKDDPNVLTTADVGKIVIGEMMTLEPEYTMKALQLLSTTEHWNSEGFNPEDQVAVVQQVTEWTISGPEAVDSLKKVMMELIQVGEHTSEQLDADHMAKVVAGMPAAAARLTAERMRAYRQEVHQQRVDARKQLFRTEGQQSLLVQLLGGVSFQDGGIPDMAKQVLRRGVAARPETLLFAKWLSANATSTANRFQHQCFNYTGQSSSPLDAFNTQIQGMVKKISGFITLMKDYSTPAGIEKLEDLVSEFATKAMDDVFTAIKNMILGTLNQVEGAVNATKDAVANGLDGQKANLIQLPMHADMSVARRLMYGSDSDAHPALHGDFASAHTALMRQVQPQGAPPIPEDAMAQVSDVWVKVSTMLREVQEMLPTAVDLLKFARKEVSSVSATLDSLFSTLADNGKDTFDQAAYLYKMIWVFYYYIVMPLTLAILYYGFWASGYFGGPKAIEEETEEYEPPQTFMEKCRCCCNACCNCCRKCHDLQICFWSFIVLFQIIVLLLFVISIVFMVLSGVKVFVGSSCAQIYILGDTKVCTEMLQMLSNFLSTFKVGNGEVPLSMACEHHNLKTCTVIESKLLTSVLLTVVGSFVACVFSFQLIFDTAMLHERARWRRIIAEMEVQPEK